MSLSFWIRDYVFIPLATVRRDWWWLYLVLVASMAMFGLWHGAKLTFISWGIYHGLLLVLHRIGQQMKRQLGFAISPVIGRPLATTATFMVVSIGWIFFRANDLGQATVMLESILAADSYRRLALPPTLYMLVPAVMIGYFVFSAVSMSIKRLDRTSNPEAEPDKRSAAVELLQLLRDGMWWWLTPMSLAALLTAGIVIFQENLPANPFLYTLF